MPRSMASASMAAAAARAAPTAPWARALRARRELTYRAVSASPAVSRPTSSIREDPRRRGLLYAATERRVYVSFDDGNRWQSLQLNMAPSSVRDIVVKDDDLVAATHGRGFWILDDLTPLRQIDGRIAAADVVLFKPQTAYRVRWNTNTDTPRTAS